MNKETYEALKWVVANFPYNDNGENKELGLLLKWIEEVAKDYNNN